jgi:low temperature requirement protein LtrA
LGRNAYSFAHLPLMAGVVLVALGMKKVLEYVSDIEMHTLTDPLKGVALAALFWGPVIYLLGHVAFKWLTTHQISAVRVVTAGLLLLGWLVAASVPAVAQLAVVAAILAGAVGVETILYAEHRRQIRAELTDA